MAVAMGSKLIVFITVVGLGIVGAFGWVGFQLFTTGFSAKTEPHALEVLIARQIRHLAIPIEKRDAQNPIPLRPDVIKEALNPKTKKDLEEEAAFDQFLQGDDAAAARTESGHHH